MENHVKKTFWREKGLGTGCVVQARRRKQLWNKATWVAEESLKKERHFHEREGGRKTKNEIPTYSFLKQVLAGK